MTFTKILCLALVIGSASSQVPLNRVINIYVDPAQNGVDPATFTLPPGNNDIRCTQIDNRGDRRRTIERDVIDAMTGLLNRQPLAGLLAQAQANNQHVWQPPFRGNVAPNPSYILMNNQRMTLRQFLNMLNLNVTQGRHFLFQGNYIPPAQLRNDFFVEVTISYHATRRGHDNQHHTIEFNIRGI